MTTGVCGASSLNQVMRSSQIRGKKKLLGSWLSVTKICHNGRVQRTHYEYRTCPRPRRWGGLSYKKDRGAHRKVCKEPLTGTKILLCERGLNFFHPPRGTKSETKLNSGYISCQLFLSSIPEKVQQKLPLWTF